MDRIQKFDAQPEMATYPVRHWACFPLRPEGHAPIASPQTFRLLVESAAGRLAVATMTLRNPPDKALATDVARLIDELVHASNERIAGEFVTRHGLPIELLDCDLDRDDPLDLTSAIPRAIAQEARRVGKSGFERLSLAALRESVTDRVAAEWLTTRSAFISRLDPDSVVQARAIDGLRPSSYNYLNTVSTDKRRNRAQAMTVFPVLQSVLLTPQFDAVRDAIDQGRPLIDVLAEHYRASQAMLRAFRGVTREHLGHRAGQLGMVIQSLREIPPNWWPREPASWRKFANAADTIARISRQPITTTANQLWLRQCAQKHYELPERTPEDLARLGQEIDEFMDALRRALHWVRDSRKASSEVPNRHAIELAAELKADLGLVALCRLAPRFGDAYRRAVTDFAEEAELWRGVRWPAIGDGPREYGDVLIHPLLTPADLKEEGARMSNCVAGYVERCMKGSSQIWSVRLRDGMRLSTLETRIRTYANHRKMLTVQQHTGVRNGTPATIACQAVHEHLAGFSAAQEQINTYLNWKQAISSQPLEARQRHALMQPVVTALEQTLSGKWSWPHLVAALSMDFPKGLQCVPRRH